MPADTSFEVIVRRKVPYATSLLFHTLVVFSITLLIIYLFFLPAKHAPDEMKAAYFILAVPEFVKNALLISGIGFLIILPLYLKIRLYRNASLTFHKELITLRGQRINIDIPINSILKVYCIDAKTISGELKYKLTVYFQQKNENTTRVRLKDYVESEKFMDQLMQYENINFSAYEFDVRLDTIDEE
ncbi:MAG: hypothetical protein ABIR18_10400 [Chitinophagaceae bacterium]